MLQITVQPQEFYNEKTEEFYSIDKPQTLTLEHSLLSVAKWEARWKKPFLDNKPKTDVEMRDYIRCMTLTQNVNPIVYNGITAKQVKEIEDYMNDPMTAATFTDHRRSQSRPNGQFVTSELIYYWMTVQNIPFECQKWHLNRLMTLIRVCSEENAPKQKMSKKDAAARNRSLNAARRKKYHTKG